MTVCLPASSVSHGLHITNSLSATQSLIKEAVGLPFKADSTYPASHQWPSGSSISNEQLVFNCLTQGLWQITISYYFCCTWTWIADFRLHSLLLYLFSLPALLTPLLRPDVTGTTRGQIKTVLSNDLNHKWKMWRYKKKKKKKPARIKLHSVTVHASYEESQIWFATVMITSLIMLYV